MQPSEKTLIVTRPTRLMSAHYYLFATLLFAAAIVAYLDPWGWVPDGWALGPLSFQAFLGLLLVAIGFPFILAAELRRLGAQYVVTDARVIRRDGILRRRLNQIPYHKVERVELNQGIIARIFRIGDVVIDSGEDQVVFAAVGAARTVHDTIAHQVSGQPKGP